MKKILFILMFLPAYLFGQVSDATMTTYNNTTIINNKVPKLRGTDFNTLFAYLIEGKVHVDSLGVWKQNDTIFISYYGEVDTIPPPAGFIYPGAGIAVSTGSAWGTSVTNNSANWNTAYSHVGSDNDLSATNEIQNLSYTAATRTVNISGGTGATIAAFSTSGPNYGLVPGSNSQSTYFLRGDGTWAEPSGVGGGLEWADTNQVGGVGLATYDDLRNAGSATDHGTLTGLADDDHAQYALLAGRTNDAYKTDTIRAYADPEITMIGSAGLRVLNDLATDWGTLKFGNSFNSRISYSGGDDDLMSFRINNTKGVNLKYVLSETQYYFFPASTNEWALGDPSNYWEKLYTKNITDDNTNIKLAVPIGAYDSVLVINGNIVYKKASDYLKTEVDGSTSNELQDLTYDAVNGHIEISNGSDADIGMFATASTNYGLVPGSNSQTTYFLRGDGQWAAAGGTHPTTYNLSLGTGLSFTSGNGTGIIHGNAATIGPATGYVIPTTTQETNWGTAYTHSGLTGNPHSTDLDDISNPSTSKTFTMAANDLVFSYTNPVGSDGAFEIQATGAFTGDLLHVHQHTGNVGTTDLVHIEASDADVTPLRVTGSGGSFVVGNTGAVTSGSWTASAITDTYVDNGISLTNITQIGTRPVTSLTANNWKVFYSNGSGTITELDLGADGTYLKSNGANVAPTFATPSGSGNVSKVGTPLDNQVGVWTGDGTIEGDADLVFNGTKLTTTQLYITTPTAGNADYDAFLALDVTGTEVKTRTGAQLASDIGALTSEVDGSLSNEGSLSVAAGSGTSSEIVSNTSGSTNVTVNAAGILSISETASSITITGTEVDGSVSNEGSLSVAAGSGTSSELVSSTSGSTNVTINASGILSISETANSITLTATEVDGNTTNEIEVVDEAYSSANFNGGTAQAVSQDDFYDYNVISDADDDGLIAKVDLASAGFVKTDASGNLSVDGATYLTAEVDGSVSNEGSLTVVAGGANDSQIQSNTSGSTNVTISGGTNITVTEASSTITVATGSAVVDYTGSPTTNYVPYMSDANTITGESVFQYDASNNILTVDLVSIDRATTGTFGSGHLETFVAGESINAYELVCISTADNNVYKVDRDAVGTAKVIGFAVETKTATQAIRVLTSGVIYNSAWNWTRGVYVYNSSTAGEVTATVPATAGYGQKVGIATDVDRIQIQIGSLVGF